MRLFQLSAAAACLAWVVGCTARMPLDAVVASTAIKGQITVTVLNGTSPTAGVNVQVVAPNGASQTKATTSTLAAPGQAIFSEPYAGTYSVSIANQPSQAPNTVPVSLTVAQPYASVNLQIGYGYLSVVAADGKPLNYDETLTYHTFTLTYINPSNLQQDATVFFNQASSSLPPGWQVICNSVVLKAGQSTSMVIQTAPWTIYGNVIVAITAICNSHNLATAPIVLTQKWSPVITINYSQSQCDYYWEAVNFLCENCTNSGNTVVENLDDSGNNCPTSVTQVLTDGLTVPDGNGLAFESGQTCIGTEITFNTTFQNNVTYTFTLPLSGCYWSYNNYATTIAPSMLNLGGVVPTPTVGTNPF